MKILLVDDEKNILDSVSHALKRIGHEVVTAAGFNQAVEGGLVLMLSVPMALTAAVRTGQIWKSVEFV